MERINREEAVKLVVDHRLKIANSIHKRACAILEQIYPKIKKTAKSGQDSYVHYLHTGLDKSEHMDVMVLVIQDLKANGFTASHGAYTHDYQDAPNKGNWSVTISWR